MAAELKSLAQSVNGFMKSTPDSKASAPQDFVFNGPSLRQHKQGFFHAQKINSVGARAIRRVPA